MHRWCEVVFTANIIIIIIIMTVLMAKFASDMVNSMEMPVQNNCLSACGFIWAMCKNCMFIVMKIHWTSPDLLNRPHALLNRAHTWLNQSPDLLNRETSLVKREANSKSGDRFSKVWARFSKAWARFSKSGDQFNKPGDRYSSAPHSFILIILFDISMVRDMQTGGMANIRPGLLRFG